MTDTRTMFERNISVCEFIHRHTADGFVDIIAWYKENEKTLSEDGKDVFRRMLSVWKEAHSMIVGDNSIILECSGR